VLYRRLKLPLGDRIGDEFTDLGRCSLDDSHVLDPSVRGHDERQSYHGRIRRAQHGGRNARRLAKDRNGKPVHVANVVDAVLHMLECAWLRLEGVAGELDARLCLKARNLDRVDCQRETHRTRGWYRAHFHELRWRRLMRHDRRWRRWWRKRDSLQFARLDRRLGVRCPLSELEPEENERADTDTTHDGEAAAKRAVAGESIHRDRRIHEPPPPVSSRAVAKSTCFSPDRLASAKTSANAPC